MRSTQLLIVLILAPVGVALGVHATDTFQLTHFFQDLAYMLLASLAYYGGALDSDDEGYDKRHPEGIVVRLFDPASTASVAGLETK